MSELAQRCPTCGGLVDILTDKVEGTSFMRSIETGALEDLIAAQEAVELEAASAASFQRQRNMAAADVELLSYGLRQIAARPTVERNPDGVDQAAATMKMIAEDTLAACKRTTGGNDV